MLDQKPDIKILLVDDREDNLLSIEAVLGQDKYLYSRANSGRQALKILLKEQDFSLILMDVQMPDLNGFETATMIYDREKLKNIPIIFITAHDYGDENMYKGYKAGAVDYIFKPINADLLKAKVSVFIDLYKKNNQLRLQEQKLKAINNELEERVRQRTEELLKKNIELESKNLELNKINYDLDNFVYTASHDLKGPIANLEGLIHMLNRKLKDKITDEELQLFNMIHMSISKFNHTIKDLTEITRVQKDMNEELEYISFAEITDDIKRDIQKLIDESNAVVVENFGVDKIMYARKNLRSILYNLITNGIKYRSSDREAEITISTYQEEDFIVLSVQDNGLGLNPNQQSKLFNMFKRLHTHVEGSGIGLYIVKRIVENSGGRIQVESEPGKGTTFRVYFKKALATNGTPVMSR
ncbi:hybrid sensor histidine kinase/response regulator [Rhodocytophaga rosea]|uniref:histidine kinase n=1 Tax=Rhodocytophaga rosea TaxID=2704465 RepID=A0A6C0GG43_9BACT|nr:hybrid sensor histidine kinase/response regulator [Rhodocytophaga rosea]QHT66650.1 hybrid sensor histidine kinase/response regulator [Rhodocytophaga rosea]